MSNSTYRAAQDRLTEVGIAFETRTHDAESIPEVEFGMCSPEEVPIPEGAKAIVVKGKKSGKFYHLVVPENLRLDQKKVKTFLGERFSFASEVELLEVTDCIPGSVPPFGSLIGLRTFADPRIKETEDLVFNCGTRTDSMRLRTEDYLKVEQPEFMDITE
jgi:Ala-tRNA(Pro) deacylase